MHPFVFLSLALYSSFSTASLAEASKTLSGFSVDLIHRDSPLSPFYDPSLTTSERIINSALRSNSRLNGAAHSLNENKSPQPILIPAPRGEYLMRFYIGTPPVERLAIADTGSDLIWVQCSPCDHKCFPQDTPLFDPTKSSTFANLSCDSQPCTLIPFSVRGCASSACTYLYHYGDSPHGSFAIGVLGTESIHFGSQTVTFPKSIFGCGSNNYLKDRTSDKVTGVVGLGPGKLSLVSQLGDQIGHKFSYCLVPFSSNSTSKLKFGNQATIIGNGVVSTPLIIDPTFPFFYFVHLEGVTVGQKMVQTYQPIGNIAIDSGTKLTYLETRFYYKFVALFKEVLAVSEAMQDIPYPFDFCFPYQANITFPKIVFQFTGSNVSVSPKT